jgi:hypothetical protein
LINGFHVKKIINYIFLYSSGKDRKVAAGGMIGLFSDPILKLRKMRLAFISGKN